MIITKLFALGYLLTVSSAGVVPLGNTVPRIINGFKAEKGQFPFIVSLRNPYDNHFCGGSILNENWILTAAHCVYGIDANGYSIVAGAIHVKEEGMRREISKVITDEDIDNNVWIPDIALVKLSEPLVFNERIQPIPLQNEFVPGGRNITILGWGDTEEATVTKDLKFANVESISWKDCKEALNPYPVYDFNFCTSTYTFQGVCFGDSGSPVVYDGKVTGIVNWGKACAIGAPDVHSRVSSFVNWINEEMARN